MPQIFENKKIFKLIHGADSDIKILLSSMNIQMICFFDTRRLTETFLPSLKTIGLSHLCKKVLSLEIDKTFQCSPWNLRPLPAVMKRYACLDSLILFPVFGFFMEEFGRHFLYLLFFLNLIKEICDSSNLELYFKGLNNSKKIYSKLKTYYLIKKLNILCND